MLLLLSGSPPLMVRFARFIRKLFVLGLLCIMQRWGRLFLTIEILEITLTLLHDYLKSTLTILHSIL